MIRTFVAICTFALLLTGAGCGGDDENGDRSADTAPAATAEPTRTAEAPGLAGEAEREREEEQGGDSGPSTSPEDQPGGAGDEEAARSEAVFEFSRRGLSPSEIRVPPFIPVVLIVRSDGTEYDLSYTAPRSGGGANGTTEADFDIDGLRPGERIEVDERNTGSRAVVVASDEVGP